MIITKDLTKTFKRRISRKEGKFEKITAVDHIDLTIKKGEIFGLIGPNGAGKTTTLKILSALITPDIGTATIDGYDVVKCADIVKNKVGLLSGEFARSLYWRLTGKQNIEFFAKLKNMWKPNERINELLELFALKQWENEHIMKYSTGMKHKLAFAIGLLNDPPVLFLDEPLTGIDPITAYELKQIIKTGFKEKTIIWASHNLYEIEEMCDRIALINYGKIVLEGEPEKLKKNYWDHTKILVISDKPHAFTSLQNMEIKGDTVEIKTDNVKKTFLEIMELTKNKNVEIKEIKTLKPSLEEIFIDGVKNV
ncbi:MAG: ABC transporter ATP-binding protein [Thermoplasmatales archaeon]|nr:ABC transporter ATP-binding protein [Thermoplasmatales archaeon]